MDVFDNVDIIYVLEDKNTIIEYYSKELCKFGGISFYHTIKS
jgi:hypothetical protein